MSKVIAIDIGGTKTVGALFDLDGNLIDKKRVPTNPSMGRDFLLESLDEIIEEYISKHSIDCIAIGSAGRIDVNNGIVHYASDNLPGWIGLNIKKRMEDKFSIPTVVDNDCNVTGLGEEWLGAAKGLDSYVLLALGTGVGAAVKINGSLAYGKNWSAGELGHMIVHPNGRQCNCGLRGCLEQYCSGPSLVRSYNALSNDRVIETGYEFFDRIEANDSIAKIVLDEFVENLGLSIISLSNIYDPDAFIIGGGLIETRQYWWDDLMKYIKDSKLNDILSPTLVAAKLGGDAAFYGAAYMGITYLKKNSK